MLVDLYRFSEWPYPAGVGCLTVLLFWHEPAPFSVSPHAPSVDSSSTFASYANQRSLQKVESNCYQRQALPEDQCSEGCAGEDRVSSAEPEEPDFSWSILTCTEQANFEGRRISGGTAHNLVIELMRTAYEF